MINMLYMNKFLKAPSLFFSQVIAFLLTFLFLFESMILFKKAMKEEKSRRESAIVDNMETQTDTQTSTSQL